jgi:hypothetical protein
MSPHLTGAFDEEHDRVLSYDALDLADGLLLLDAVAELDVGLALPNLGSLGSPDLDLTSVAGRCTTFEGKGHSF